MASRPPWSPTIPSATTRTPGANPATCFFPNDGPEAYNACPGQPVQMAGARTTRFLRKSKRAGGLRNLLLVEAQISHKYGDTIEDTIIKLEYDLYYIKNLTPALDAFIMFHTAKVMLLLKGSQ